MCSLAPTVNTDWSSSSICSELCGPLTTRSPRCTASRGTAGRSALSASVCISTLLRIAALTPTFVAAKDAGTNAAASAAAKAATRARRGTQSVCFICFLRSASVAEIPNQAKLAAEAVIVGQREGPVALGIVDGAFEGEVLEPVRGRALGAERAQRHADGRAGEDVGVVALGVEQEERVHRPVADPAQIALDVEIDARSQEVVEVRTGEGRVVTERLVARDVRLVAAGRGDRRMRVDAVGDAALEAVARAVIGAADGRFDGVDGRLVVILPDRFGRSAQRRRGVEAPARFAAPAIFGEVGIAEQAVVARHPAELPRAHPAGLFQPGFAGDVLDLIVGAGDRIAVIARQRAVELHVVRRTELGRAGEEAGEHRAGARLDQA